MFLNVVGPVLNPGLLGGMKPFAKIFVNSYSIILKYLKNIDFFAEISRMVDVL